MEKSCVDFSSSIVLFLSYCLHSSNCSLSISVSDCESDVWISWHSSLARFCYCF
jgi:hypothetical protein